MNISLQFFLDPELTYPISGPLKFEQSVDEASPQTKIVYLGSKKPNRQFEAAKNAGEVPITISIINAKDTHVKLARDPDDLNHREFGDSLKLQPTLLSGPINAIPIYVQVKDESGVVSVNNDIQLVTNAIVETATQ